MIRVVAISGSLRRDSFNTRLLQAVGERLPDGVELCIESLAAVPLYNGDVEQTQGIPARVADLKDAVAASDGLLISTPEYNNSIPGVLKNAVDWMTRPPKDIARVFRQRPVAVIGATPGAFGTVLAQAAWLPVLRTLGMRPFNGARLMVPGAARVFDDHGAIPDDAVADRVQKFVDEFVAFLGDAES